MLVRLAHPGDVSAILEIYAPLVRDTAISFEMEVPSQEEMKRRMSEGMPRHPWLVALEEGSVTGYAYASQHRTRAAYRWAVDVSVYVAGCHRGRGVGLGLYTVLFDILRAQGYRSAHAGITLPNPGSVALHESMGFVPVGVYRSVGWKVGRWHDVGWWQLQLNGMGAEPSEPLSLDEVDATSLPVLR